eukprot:scaffold198230_cov30-Tisochrysis_lutea.AAC.3
MHGAGLAPEARWRKTRMPLWMAHVADTRWSQCTSRGNITSRLIPSGPGTCAHEPPQPLPLCVGLPHRCPK